MRPEQLISEDEGASRFSGAITPLLSEAEARLRRQKRYANPLSKGGSVAEGIEALLQKASDCISDIATPSSVLVPVTAKAIPDGVRLGGSVSLHGSTFANAAINGASVVIYLQTLGYDQPEAFDWLEGEQPDLTGPR